VPQIGWNQVHYTPHAAQHPLFTGIDDGSDFYFVHSYYCDLTDERDAAAMTEYGVSFRVRSFVTIWRQCSSIPKRAVAADCNC
jgi:imidazoleglycerol phosphate synthase glutamine amidotransferase subunit HisH